MDKKIQYRQIDFLRLFRLCRQRGIVKRKRKTPTEYGDDSSGARGAGKRLLRALIKELFNEFEINSDFGTYFLAIPRADRDMLSGLSSRTRTFFDNAQEGADALRRFGELRQNISGHILPSLPYEIKIHIGSNDPADRHNSLQGRGIATARPRENFYVCAISCIKYKELWDEHMPFLRTFYERESRIERQREEQAREAQRERRRLERERLLQERAEREEQERERMAALRRLETQLENERVARVEGAQSAFDRAMQQYMGENS